MATRYVDFTAANNGDGTTAAQASGSGTTGAYNTLVGVTLTSNDIVYIRRAGSITLAGNFTTTQFGVQYVGWPISGDALYSTRPATGTSNGWDADSNQLVVINMATFLWTEGQVGCSYTRIEWTRGATTNTAMMAVTGNTATFTTCTIQNTTQLTTLATVNQVAVSGTNCTMTACTITGGNYSTTTSGCSMLAISGNFFTATNLTMNATFLGSNGAVTGVPGIVNTANYTFFDSLTMNYTGNAAPSGTFGAFISIQNSYQVYHNVNIAVTNASVTASLPSIYFPAGTTLAGVSLEINQLQAYAGGAGFVQFGSPTALTAGAFAATNHIIFNNLACGSTAFLINGVTNTLNGWLFVFRNCTSSNTSGYVTAISAFFLGCRFIFNNCTLGAADYVTLTYLSTDCWVRGQSQAAAYYAAHAGGGKIISSNTARTGGSSYSYKVNCTATPTGKNSGRDLFPLSAYDVESIWIALSTGAHTVSFYGAMKNFGVPPDGTFIYIEVEYLDGSGNIKVARSPVTLTTDTSTWTGDSGLTIFVITATFTVGTAGNMPVRLVLGCPVDGSGYYYIDPIPVVV